MTFRIIPRLEIKNENLIKGKKMEGLKIIGNPIEYIKNYYDEGADEILICDIVASLYGRKFDFNFLKKISNDVFLPLIIGGGLNEINDINVTQFCFLILGAGGVTPSLIFALEKKGITKIFISNRTVQKAEAIKKKFPFIEIILWENMSQKCEEMDVIINATSLGMKDYTDFDKPIKKFK